MSFPPPPGQHPSNSTNGQFTDTTGQQHQSPEAPKPSSIPANQNATTVGVSTMVKYNINKKDHRTGNFMGISVQIQSSCTLPCSYENRDQAYRDAEAFALAKLEQTRTRLITNFGLQSWFQ